MSQPATPMTPEQELTWVHRKRQQFLDQLELKVMTDEKTPVSLLSLYRNTLRDHEAACYKRLEAESRDPKPAVAPAMPTPAVPKGKTMLASCFIWLAAMITMWCGSAAQAQSTMSCETTQTDSTHMSYTSALRLDARPFSHTTVPSDTATKAPCTPPVSD